MSHSELVLSWQVRREYIQPPLFRLALEQKLIFSGKKISIIGSIPFIAFSNVFSHDWHPIFEAEEEQIVIVTTSCRGYSKTSTSEDLKQEAVYVQGDRNTNLK